MFDVSYYKRQSLAVVEVQSHEMRGLRNKVIVFFWKSSGP